MENFLLMNVVSFLTSILLLVTLGFYFWQFQKLEKIKSKINFLISLITLLSLGLAFLFSMIGLILSAINYDDQPVSALVLWIISLIIIIATIIAIFICLQYYAIALTSDAINLLGERILYSNIKDIIHDEETKKIFIFYRQGKRVVKKLVVSQWMVPSDFFDSSVTGITIKNENVQAYMELQSKDN